MKETFFPTRIVSCRDTVSLEMPDHTGDLPEDATSAGEVEPEGERSKLPSLSPSAWDFSTESPPSWETLSPQQTKTAGHLCGERHQVLV